MESFFKAMEKEEKVEVTEAKGLEIEEQFESGESGRRGNCGRNAEFVEPCLFIGGKIEFNSSSKSKENKKLWENK